MTSMTYDRKTANNELPYNSLLDQYSLLLDSVDQNPTQNPSVDYSVDDTPRADLGCFGLLLTNEEQQKQQSIPEVDINATISEETPDGANPNEIDNQPCDNDTADHMLSKERKDGEEMTNLCNAVMQKQKHEEDDPNLHSGGSEMEALESITVDIVRERIKPPLPPKPSSQLSPSSGSNPTITSQTLSKLSISFHGIAHATSRRVSVLAEQALSHATALAHPYTSTVSGCATETALFVADRARLLADRYIRAIASDDPEVRHMQRMMMAREAVWGWMYQQSCFLSTLPWHLRRLLRETRDLDEAIEEALVASETEAKARRQQQRTDSQKEGDAHSSENESVIHTSSSSSSSSSSNSSSNINGRNNSSSDSKSNNNSSGNKDSSGNHVSADVPIKAADVGVAGFHHWLLGRASAGDEEAQYAVTRWFTPPTFQEADHCQHPKCAQKFGPKTGLFRHHCRHCGISFCTEHSSQRRALLRFGMGLLSPVRVCDACATQIDDQAKWDLLQFRKMRVHAFFAGTLIAYSDSSIDRGIDKALRVAECSLNVVKNTVSLNYPTKLVLNTIDVLKLYGLSGLAGVLMRRDFVEAVETLKRISGMDKLFAMSLHELTACIYYKLAIDRGLRGCDPDGEARDHNFMGLPAPIHPVNREKQEKLPEKQPEKQPETHCKHGSSSSDGTSGGGNVPPSADTAGCREVADFDLDEAIRLAPLALSAVYEESPAECQRVAATQGWTTVFLQLQSGFEQPSYALFASSLKKEAVLAIRGTASVQDIVTDIRAEPMYFPPNDEDLFQGTVAMMTDLHELNNPIHTMRPDDSRFSVSPPVDHTSDPNATRRRMEGNTAAAKISQFLNGGVFQHQHQHQPQSNVLSAQRAGGEVEKSWDKCKGIDSSDEDDGWVHVEGGTTYACGGMARAAHWLLEEVGPSLWMLVEQGYTITFVGHSLGAACAALLCLLLRRGYTTMSSFPRSPVLHDDTFRCIAYGCPSCVDEKLANEMKGYVMNVVLHDDIIPRITPQSIRGLMRELMVFRAQVFRHLRQDWKDVIDRTASVWSPRTRSKSSKDNLLGPVPMTQSGQRLNEQGQGLLHHDKTAPSKTQPPHMSSPLSPDLPSPTPVLSPVESDLDILSDADIEAGLWPLWLPGRVVHLYSHRGCYFACEVPLSYPSLRKIEVQGHIFANHRSIAIFDALLEVRAVRAAARTVAGAATTKTAAAAGAAYKFTHLPVWTHYDDTDVCECCHSLFTWHSTFSGEAQEYRERYNCRQCGSLVCGPCSMQRHAVPRIGLLAPQRLCDTCFFKGDYAHM